MQGVRRLSVLAVKAKATGNEFKSPSRVGESRSRQMRSRSPQQQQQQQSQGKGVPSGGDEVDQEIIKRKKKCQGKDSRTFEENSPEKTQEL